MRVTCEGKPDCELSTEDWEDADWFTLERGLDRNNKLFHDLNCLIWWATNEMERPPGK